MSFVACSSVTGESICAEILAVLERLGLDTDLCRGQGYDGAGSMSGHMRGCQARFREVSPHATYFHCSSHQLNLALSKSASVSEVSAMVSNLKALGVFFKYSPKRQRALEDAVVTINEQRHANNEALIAPTKFKMLCDTRWVERHTAFETFHELYAALLYCLDDIGRNGERNWDAESISKASGLLTVISSSAFIAAFQTNHYFLGFTKSLSILLQGCNQDLLLAYDEIRLVRETLKKEREDVRKAFEEPFEDMQAMARLAGADGLSIPRRCGRQTQRSNVEATTAEEYWRRTVFVPYLDHLLAELSDRFSTMASKAVQGMLLLPPNVQKLTKVKIEELLVAYGNDLPSRSTFQQEVKLWKCLWESDAERQVASDLPQTISETLVIATAQRFPNINTILTVLLVLPVTTATVERGNSSLGYVKSDLRSTMREDRLNALMLLFVHKGIPLDHGKVIDKFATRHSRRMLLVDPVSSDE